MKRKIKVDIVSDVVCPWCYIGKRRFEKAVQQLSSDYDFDIQYRPFELNPDMPLEGVDQKDYLTKKFGGETRFNEITRHVAHVAAQEGLQFNFDQQKVSPNTRKAHSLIQYAKSEGKQPELVEAFFKAYFTDGIDLSDDANVLHVAVEAGLNREAAENVLNDENGSLQIALEEQAIYKLGISGVPFYIINNRYGLSGAQPTEVFIQAFEKASKEITVEDKT